MTTSAERYRTHRGVALFSMGFRPFFLFAAGWAALAVPLWLAAYAGLLPASQFTRDWHVHEMLFGYLPAVIAGFLLTAVPNWTGRLPVTGWPLFALFALWGAGRTAMLASLPLSAWIDGLFLFALSAVIGREVIAGRNLRNLPVCLLVSVLGAANVIWHARVSNANLGLLGERIALGVVAMLVTLIGGRIVPSFTRNWMAKQHLGPEPAPTGRFDIVVLAVTALALLSWIASLDIGGALLLAAGALNALRLARWHGWVAAADPLVLVLHVGYLWLAAALALLGLSIVAPMAAPSAAGIHALTAGAFGVMTLAVMTRASLGHTGRLLAATPATQLVYVLVNGGALVRTVAAFFPDAYVALLTLSAVLWSGAFALFAWAYAPLLLQPRIRT